MDDFMSARSVKQAFDENGQSLPDHALLLA